MALIDRQALSQSISNLGSNLGLPEFRISEFVGGGQISGEGLSGNNPLNTSLQQQRSAGIQPTQEQFLQQSSQQFSPAPTGQVQGATTQPSGGDGGGRRGELERIGDNRNPSQQTEFENLLAQLQQQQGPSQDEINSQFAPIFDVFNQAESNLRGQQPGLIQEAEAQAKASRGLLEGQRTGAEELLGQQTAATESQRGNQVADQRRILQELSQANQQRFGGASSAGQAASELQGREFQRSRFGIQQNAQQALQAIGNERNKVEREFQQGLQQLEVNKQQAVNEIDRRFQNKLLEINARRGETEAAKAQARMGALQDFRNKNFQINVAKAEFENSLRQQTQANTQQLSQIERQYLDSTQAGQGASDQFGATTPSGIPGVQPGQQQSQGLTGSIQDDELFGSIAGSSDRDPRFQNFQPSQSFGR